uniref:BRCT domain-containing protein n=1 Tax=Sphenodon punctatus TaxID=8508 RepID=A0A8D0HCW2_SPHPU
ETKEETKRTQPARRAQRTAPTSTATPPKVLFTGVIDEAGERVVVSLGGSLAESVYDCTHLVTDRVRRTVKFLCTLARGVPIVTLEWLHKSGRNSCFLAPGGFLVEDPEQEQNFGFSLVESLQRAQRSGGVLQVRLSSPPTPPPPDGCPISQFSSHPWVGQ